MIGTQVTLKHIWKLVKLINDLLFPIDKQIGWVPFALVNSIKLINQYKIRNIYITAFPQSAFLIGLFLKFIYGNRIFWAADYRDAWQYAPLIDNNVLPFRKKIIIKIDDLVLKKSDKIVFVSPYVKQRYANKFNWINEKADVITNGYDEDDFVELEPKKFGKFTIVYMGKIHTTKRKSSTIIKNNQRNWSQRSAIPSYRHNW